MRKLKNVLVQFVKFGIVGVSNTAISLLIYYLFIYINKDLYLIGNTIGFVISVFNSYYWNSRYVFIKSRKGHFKPLVKTFMAYGITFVISSALLFAMVNILEISTIIAPIVNLLITMPLNFIFNRFWAMR